MPAARRTRRVSESRIWAAIGIAMAVHLVLAIVVSVGGITLVGEAFTVAGDGSGSARPEDPDVELQAACRGNAVLATAARGVLCLAPWRGDVTNCAGETEVAMWMDLSACNASPSTAAAVAMISPRELEKITPIDPE